MPPTENQASDGNNSDDNRKGQTNADGDEGRRDVVKSNVL